jgi:hypothetical protein
MLRRINLSAATIVLICFFLPWEQVSCGGAKDTLSGLDLARHESTLLWVIPLLILAVLIFAWLRRRAAPPHLQALLGLVAGGATAYLMNDERVRVNDAATVISARLTGWFWLGLIAALGMVASAIAMFIRPRSPAE